MATTKRCIRLLLALVMVLVFLPMTARAETLSNGLAYEVYDDHVEITDYTRSATEVVIPAEIEGKPVTSIGDHAFYECALVTSIVLPDGVTSIGDSAFEDCLRLTTVDLPEGLTTIGNYAFADCRSLISIDLPDGLTSIGNYAFSVCRSLTSIDIPNSVSAITDYTFDYCTSLTTINLPDEVTSIGAFAFNYCENLTSIDLPDGLTSIGDSAFEYCTSLTSIDIPDGVTSIGAAAFYKCQSLTSIDIPDGITSIGDNAFCYCENLTSIDLPDGLTSISNDAFGHCSNLTSVDIPDGVTSIGSGAFVYCSSLASIDIPDGVTFIGDQAFDYCTGLTNIDIPDGVKTIGEYTFYYCTNLTGIGLPDGLTSIGYNAFGCCYRLTGIVIPDSVTTLGDYAFRNCECLTSIVIPDGVTSIGNYAFRNCYRLTSIDIPDSVTSIGDYAFWYCYSLNSICFKGDAPSIAQNAFQDGSITAYYPAGNPTWTEDMLQDYGGTITWTPYTKVKITQQPVDATAAEGKTAKVTVTATGDGLTYQWYYKDAGSSKFYLTTSFTGNTYQVAMNSARDGRQIYCVITDQYGNSVKTNTVTLTMGTPLAITKQPANVTIAKGKTASVYVNTTGEGLTYKWYYKNAGDSKFYLTNSFKGNTYSVTMDASRNGRQVYCVISDKYGNSVQTNTVTLKMATLTITKQSTDVTVPKGKNATAYVNVSGEGLTFKWYYKNAGDSRFYLTNSFKSNVYSVTMDATRNGRQVYCVITDKYGYSVQSNAVTLKMATPLAITTQPTNMTVAQGATASTTVTATGDDLRYTWYVMDVGTKTWTKSSITSKTYAFAMTAAKSGRHVYCVVTDAYGNTVTTKSVTMNMKSGVSITTQPVSTTVVNGKTATVKVTATGNGLTYKWYYKNPGDANFYLTNSFKGNTYSVTMDASRNGRQVYCVISDSNGNTVATNIVSLKMK